MFMFSGFSFALIALALGCLLLVKVCPEPACCRNFFKFIGWLIVVLSFVSLICSGYHMYKKKMGDGHHVFCSHHTMDKSHEAAPTAP